MAQVVQIHCLHSSDVLVASLAMLIAHFSTVWCKKESRCEYKKWIFRGMLQPNLLCPRRIFSIISLVVICSIVSFKVSYKFSNKVPYHWLQCSRFLAIQHAEELFILSRFTNLGTSRYFLFYSLSFRKCTLKPLLFYSVPWQIVSQGPTSRAATKKSYWCLQVLEAQHS